LRTSMDEQKWCDSGAYGQEAAKLAARGFIINLNIHLHHLAWRGRNPCTVNAFSRSSSQKMLFRQICVAAACQS